MSTWRFSVIYIILVGVLMLIGVVPWLVITGQSTPELGNGLARKMIERAAAGNGAADVSDFADKICFTPEGGPSTSQVDRLFPGFRLAFTESDESEGVWFLMLGFNEEKIVKILAVQQIVLEWPVPGEGNYNELIRCPRMVSISFEGRRPRITP
jgi:hypothetical protein